MKEVGGWFSLEFMGVTAFACFVEGDHGDFGVNVGRLDTLNDANGDRRLRQQCPERKHFLS